jgi:hypothetical protein
LQSLNEWGSKLKNSKLKDSGLKDSKLKDSKLKDSSPPTSLTFPAEQLAQFIFGRELINACGPCQGSKTTIIAGRHSEQLICLFNLNHSMLCRQLALGFGSWPAA